MTYKELLLEQMEACGKQKGWFVAMSDALAGLTAEQAARSSDNGSHSVWQIVNHVVFWNERYLMRFQGRHVNPVDGNDSTFEGAGGGSGEAEWKSVRERFDSVMVGWQKAISEAPDAKLEGPITQDSKEIWYTTLAHMNIHTAYHIGQIVTVRKHLGAWDPAQGVS